MNIFEAIYALTEYGVRKGLIDEMDRTYTINRYLELFGEDDLLLSDEQAEAIRKGDIDLVSILYNLTETAYDKGLIEDHGITQSDLFDTKLMGVLVGKPSGINALFREKYQRDPEAATAWFYELSQNTNYIRKERIAKDRKWTVNSEYGIIDITINLSKPEKDPKAIAAAKTAKQTSYPKCLLCMENEGYAGRINHPARQNHRIIQLKIAGQDWGFQYSPYVYYNEHCIVFNGQHTPMQINRNTFEKLFSFVEQFPHYFLGSNADLPIVGGSILSHDHFQGGHYEFAMERAETEKEYVIKGFEDVKTAIVHWPLSVIRIASHDYHRLIDLADHILKQWKGYTDEDAFIFAETEGEAHNTITPIARKRGDLFELDLTLRNNITTESSPLGVYHPRQEYHHIKKENIGLIEVMGLAVLPARLENEMAQMEKCLLEGVSPLACEATVKHAEWLEEIREKYQSFTKQNVRSILEQEIGHVFVKVLEDAGVYKCNDEGRTAFERFMKSL